MELKNRSEAQEQQLTALHDQIIKCKDCNLCILRKNAVPGEGRSNARIMFVGEAPGRINDEYGRPFIGHGGKIFDKMLMHVGIRRSEVFVTNVVKCWPPGNRRPKREEIQSCRKYLERQIEYVSPKLIFAMGITAFVTLTGRKMKMKDCHGKVYDRNGIGICPTYHPNALRYLRGGMNSLVEDIRQGLEFLEKKV